jgi:hypothetical protein
LVGSHSEPSSCHLNCCEKMMERICERKGGRCRKEVSNQVRSRRK